MELNNYFSKAFDTTLKSYSITGKALSSQSGVSQNHISGFRNGDNITVEALSKLMKAMDQMNPGSVNHFLKQVMELTAPAEPRPAKFKASLENLVESATDEEIEGLMVVIARKWRLKSNHQEKELCA